MSMGTVFAVVFANDGHKFIWKPSEHIQHHGRLAIERACISVWIIPSKLHGPAIWLIGGLKQLWGNNWDWNMHSLYNTGCASKNAFGKAQIYYDFALCPTLRSMLLLWRFNCASTLLKLAISLRIGVKVRIVMVHWTIKQKAFLNDLPLL